MKVIDLLNKIANGEEVPKRIEYRNKIFVYDKDNQCYIVENYNEYNDLLMELSNHKGTDLLYEVEIIEEKEMCHKCHKYPTEYNQTYCEFCLGISKLEENKIPEKLKDVIEDGCIKAVDNFDLMDKINEIIDYLKEKGNK